MLGISLASLANCIWFRTGRPMPASWFTPTDEMRIVTARCGYASLPGTIALGAVAIAFGLYRMLPDMSSAEESMVTLFAVGAAIIFGLWSYKEFERPTLRRTPNWLRERFRNDPELARGICGSRPLPR